MLARFSPSRLQSVKASPSQPPSLSPQNDVVARWSVQSCTLRPHSRAERMGAPRAADADESDASEALEFWAGGRPRRFGDDLAAEEKAALEYGAQPPPPPRCRRSRCGALAGTSRPRRSSRTWK